jgi:hypothetical protein
MTVGKFRAVEHCETQEKIALLILPALRLAISVRVRSLGLNTCDVALFPSSWMLQSVNAPTIGPGFR